MRAISQRTLEVGITTSSWSARFAFRMRVSMSAMGSEVMPASPARLRHAGDDALVRQRAQADAAEPELLVHGAGASAFLAARVPAHLELGRALLLDSQCCLCHSESFTRP